MEEAELKKYLNKRIRGYSAMWSSIFSTISLGIISLQLADNKGGEIVEVAEKSIMIASYIIKIISLLV